MRILDIKEKSPKNKRTIPKSLISQLANVNGTKGLLRQ